MTTFFAVTQVLGQVIDHSMVSTGYIAPEESSLVSVQSHRNFPASDGDSSITKWHLLFSQLYYTADLRPSYHQLLHESSSLC